MPEPQSDRAVPVGTFWAEPEGFHSDITLIGGECCRGALVNLDGSIAKTPGEAEAAMGRLCKRLNAEQRLDRRSDVARLYLGDPGAIVVSLPPRAQHNDALFNDDRPEMPFPIQLEIASWRRVANRNPRAANARSLFEQAAFDLFRKLLIAQTTVMPETRPLFHHAVVDALDEIAEVWQLNTDDAQAIMEKAKAAATSPAPAPSVPRPSWRDHVASVEDLCDRRFPEVVFIVPGLIPEGVTLLVSRPKLGKSWLLLQIGSAIARGVSTLVSSGDPSSGDVLYLALEDNDRRLQRRLTKHLGALRECWPRRLTYTTRWRRLHQGGLEDLREWCKSVSEPRLIMIDTLKKVRPPKKSGQTDYDTDYEACEGLIGLVAEFPGLAIILAHHDRKMGAEDVFDTVSGTLGLIGGVDAIAILKKSGSDVTLHIQGRDLVDEVQKAVRLDRESLRWVILGEAVEVHRSTERTRVIEVLRGAADGLGVKEIMAAAGLHKREATDALLYRMVKDGEIERRGRGKYVIAGTPASEASENQNGMQAIEVTEENVYSDASDASDAEPVG